LLSCCTIFLASLEALDTSIAKTQGWWQLKTQRHGYRKRQILTVGNVLVTLFLPYVVTRDKPRKDKKKSPLQGFCPFLKWLGMSFVLTPLVWSTIAQYGAIAGSFEAACTILIDWGINISLKRI